MNIIFASKKPNNKPFTNTKPKMPYKASVVKTL